jgi:WD40 repeat protein
MGNSSSSKKSPSPSQQYPPRTQNVFKDFSTNNLVTENGKKPYFPKGRRGFEGEPGVPPSPSLNKTVLPIKLSDGGNVIAFSYDNKKLAIGTEAYMGNPSNVKIYNEGKYDTPLVTFENKNNSISAITFSHDGSNIAVGATSGIIKLYNVETGELIGELKGHNGEILSLEFSTDGSHLLSCANKNLDDDEDEDEDEDDDDDNEDYTIIIWDMKTQTIEHSLEEWACSAVFNKDGSKFVSSDLSEVTIYEVNTIHKLKSLKSDTNIVNSVDFSPNGTQVMSSEKEGVIKIWDVNNGENVNTLDIKNNECTKALNGKKANLELAKFNSDGTKIISVIKSDYSKQSADYISLLNIIDIASGKCIFSNVFSGKSKVFIDPLRTNILVSDGAVLCVLAGPNAIKTGGGRGGGTSGGKKTKRRKTKLRRRSIKQHCEK